MAGGQREHVLVVEDDAPLGRMQSRLLESFGYDVEHVTRAQEALRTAAERRPSLVVLDLMLPDGDGYALCRALRELYHASIMPIVIVTARSLPVDQLRGIASGANAYVRKPFDSMDLLKTIVTLLERPSATG